MTWIEEARRLLDRIEASQSGAIAEASRICADAIGSGGVVHTFGSGHSRIPVEEMFPRYGSFPGFHPIVELSTTFHTQVVGANGQRQAMFLERVEGLARQIWDNFTLRPADALMVFSASGNNAVTLEMAAIAREAGLKVVAVTSVAQSMAGEPRHSSGTRLLDHADVVLDLCTPPGDALCEVDGVDVPVGPGSTLAGVALVNEVKVRTAERLAAMGRMPAVLTAATVVGAERSRKLFDEAYLDHAGRAARVLRSGV
ncbi:UPF0309 protein [Amycolatopsis deserti]|uniref:UPF0309 protein n=1 Tax=Amycolatopsis deserti TaxID=185696 RepID=A0ABQ3IGS1_9PSEU|nr:SIS domain-containing protein [Amycolatopsis deserti]GHE79271.1 UPF0309 protein [Amycolatopsis deserti]